MYTVTAEITTDANGDGSAEVNLGVPFFYTNLRVWSDADRIEFVRAYAQTLSGASGSVEDVPEGGGGETGGGGAVGSGKPGSKPELAGGFLVPSGKVLKITIAAGVAYASTVFYAAIDVENVELD